MLLQINCWKEEKNSNNSKPIKVNSVTICMSIFRLVLVVFSALLISFGDEITRVSATERSGEAGIAVIDNGNTGALAKDWHAVGGRRLQRRCGSLSNYFEVDWLTDQPAPAPDFSFFIHGDAASVAVTSRISGSFWPVLHGVCLALHRCTVF